jgi:hypothetical protein
MGLQHHIPDTCTTGGELHRTALRREAGRGLGLVRELKLLFAALGAGGSVVPLGDNSRAARLLAEYAAALRGSECKPDVTGA